VREHFKLPVGLEGRVYHQGFCFVGTLLASNAAAAGLAPCSSEIWHKEEEDRYERALDAMSPGVLHAGSTTNEMPEAGTNTGLRRGEYCSVGEENVFFLDLCTGEGCAESHGPDVLFQPRGG
jgi:hypothetical protein